MFRAIKKVVSLFLPGDKQSETQDTHFKPPGELKPSSEWLIKEAYEKVMKNIEASDKFKKIVLNALIEFKQTNEDNRFFKNYIENDLILEDWSWPEFDHWYKIFKISEEWSYGWTEYLYKEPDPLPESIEKSIHYLSVKEIKNFLKKHNIAPKPMPKNRSGWEAAICNNGDWELLKPLIIEKYTEYRDHYLYKRKEDKLNLLFGDLSHCVYSQLRYYQLLDSMQYSFVKNTRRLVASGCNKKLTIEKEFVEKFNNGEISEFPPYFPGCSIMIFSERIKK